MSTNINTIVPGTFTTINSPLVYLAALSVACIAVAYFVFDSGDAVKGLVVAAVGAIGAATPGVLEKVEYQLTGSGIEKRETRPEETRRVQERLPLG